MDPKALVQDWVYGIGKDHSLNYRHWTTQGGFPARVELAPWLDAWAQGDRYGEIQRLGRDWAHVRMDRSGAVRRVPRNGFTLI